MRRRAQSSAVGTILLVGIAVVVVGGLVVTGSDVVDDAQRDGPSAAVDVRANATTLSVTHESGDPLPLGETTVVLSGGGSTRRLPLAAFDGDDGDGRATAGETLSTSYAPPARSVTVRLVHGPSDLVVVKRALSTVSPPGVAPNFSAGVDAYPLQSGQDGGGSFAVASNGTIRAEGNSWKTVPIDGEVTPDTYLTFEFRSSVEGDVHAIGVDSDGPPNWPIYKVHGCQDVFAGGTNNFDSTYDTYAGSGWTRYEIPVGEAVTGNATELHLINDDDDQCGRGSGSARFRNVRLVERPD